MNKIYIGLAIAVSVLFAASTAWADVLSITADVPISYDFDDGGSADEVSGYKVGLSLPVFPVGVGYEAYQLKEGSGSNQATVDFEIVDIFLNIPLPILNIALGAGAGTAGLDMGSVSKSTTATQYWASLGIPFAELFDIHVGYHVVSAKFENVTAGGFPIGDIDASGNMISLGLKFGF